jgi:hypothetical protein
VVGWELGRSFSAEELAMTVQDRLREVAAVDAVHDNATGIGTACCR